MLKKSFFVILALAFILRFYKLGEVPLSLDWDEVSNGYNAYSILKTGHDEYGNFLPLTNRSFDDHKPPLYMYLNIPTIAIFGLTEFAVRFPSALFGFLTVPLVFYLSRYLFKENEYGNIISLFSMFFFAISPWSLQFSRVGFEANVALFFTVLSITLFLYSLKNHKLLLLSAFAACLSIYTYHTQKIFIPLIFLSLFIIFIKDLKLYHKKVIIFFFAITILLLMPTIILSPKEALLSRYKTASIEENFLKSTKSNQLINEDQNSQIGRLIHNRKVISILGLAQNYFANFDLNFLFTKGDDNGRHHIENMGMFYLFQLPLFLIGIFLLISKHKKASLVLLSWLILAPIAAAFATPSPHAIRSMPMLIPMGIISALGLTIFISLTMKNKVILTSVLFVWMIASLAIYLHNYYYHYPINRAASWQYGFKQAVLNSEKIKQNYNEILIDSSLEQAYIYWLFYNKYDPKVYQSTGTNSHFDKYYFNAEKTKSSDKLFISYIDTPTYPRDYKIVYTIYHPNGEPTITLSTYP